MSEFEYEETAAEDIDIDDLSENIDYGYGEDYGFEEDYDFDEAARISPAAHARAAQAARARAMAQARMRAMAGRRATPVTPPRPTYFPPPPARPASSTQVRQGFTRVGSDVQKVKTGLQNVSLNTRVQTEMLSRGLKAQSARISGTENALAASTIAAQLRDQFPELVSNPIIRSALPLAPLLFMKPVKQGTGIASVASDPRVWSSVIVFALLGLKEILDRTGKPPIPQAGVPSGIAAPQAAVAPTQMDLAAQIAQLNRLTAELVQITQNIQAGQVGQAASMAQAVPAGQMPDAFQAFLTSLMTPAKEQPTESPAQTSPEQAQKPKGANV